MKTLIATTGSFLFTTAVIGNAFYHKKQFYSSMVYLTKSSPSMGVLYMQALMLVILLGKLMRRIFFGQLRPLELEHLIEKSWYAVTETCLAFTVFRDDFSPRFVALFTLLLFLKCFHWLIEDRVDYMERSPLISLLFHVRVVFLLMLLALLDFVFVRHAYLSTVTKGASTQLVFGFEYAILLTVTAQVLVKYILHTLDMQRDTTWENKAVYLLYCELVLGCVKALLYMLFLAIMIKIHTFPLFIVRPMYLTMRAFRKALNDVILSRRAIYNMNTLYPDATAEELAAGDNVCIICREEMVQGCKKLPCNHIFHRNCLRSWFQRQQTCPTCRLDVLRPADRTSVPGVQPQQPAAQGGAMFGLNGILPPGFVPPPVWPIFPPPPPPQSPSASQQTQQSQQQAQQAQQQPQQNQQQQPMTSMPVPPPFSFPPMFCPPFMFAPPPAFSVPFPTMPPNLSTLSENELRAMEGSERQNVESRVRCLQNIQTLLDAAVIQMQQYLAVCANLESSSVPATEPRATFNLPEAGDTVASSSSSTALPQSDTTETTENEDHKSIDSDSNELRRRRLERLSQT